MEKAKIMDASVDEKERMILEKAIDVAYATTKKHDVVNLEFLVSAYMLLAFRRLSDSEIVKRIEEEVPAAIEEFLASENDYDPLKTSVVMLRIHPFTRKLYIHFCFAV
jgi:hypothetical protein